MLREASCLLLPCFGAVQDLDKKHKIYLVNSKNYCTFAANFALRMVAIATKFE